MQLEDILSQGEEKCLQKPCVQSEQCCPGSVCVDLHSSPLSSSSSLNNKQRPGKVLIHFICNKTIYPPISSDKNFMLIRNNSIKYR